MEIWMFIALQDNRLNTPGTQRAFHFARDHAGGGDPGDDVGGDLSLRAIEHRCVAHFRRNDRGRRALRRLREILMNQWQSLPSGSGALLGETLKLNDRPRDEIKWTTGGGPGLLTRYAAGDFVVTMRLQPPDKKSNRLDLGFLRKPKNDSAITNAHESWVPLLENVQSLQIRYFDPRLNVWLDKWTDTVTLPRLVKVTIGRKDAAIPWEAIIPLGRTPL